MKLLRTLMDAITALFKWGACAATAFMMLLIALVVIGRAFNQPIPADVELIQLAMGVLVMMGLAYTEQSRSHVTVGLFVDHLPARSQAVLDVLAVLLIFITTAVIGWVNLRTGYDYLTRTPRSTDYLSIPLWPLKFIVGLGFWLWGVQALLRLPEIASNARHGIKSHAVEGHA